MNDTLVKDIQSMLRLREQLQMQLIANELARMGKFEDAVALAAIERDAQSHQVREAARAKLDGLIHQALDNLKVPKEPEKPKYRWVNGARVRT